MQYTVAIVGATGNVGQEILSILHERKFPIKDLIPLASDRSDGQEIDYGDRDILVVKDLDTFDFDGVDIVLASVGAQTSLEFAPRATQAGCFVIDNSSAFRMHPDIPLVVPEVNREALHQVRNQNIVASPNCIAIPLAMTLAPLHQVVPIKRVVISTYQSTSGAGSKVMEELFEQTQAIFLNQDIEHHYLSHQIAFNIIPQIDELEGSGYTGEETKVIQETKKIIDSTIEITATCVRVPVFVGHAISAHIEFARPIEVTKAQNALQQAAGICVNDSSELTTPLDCAGTDDVFVSRIRKDDSVENGLALWITSDNLRKGAALNTVQIAEALVEEGEDGQPLF
ncbi:MAG: aspartate-semialdehyde dehydrogenase [Pseudomonadota bacterium]